MPDSNGQPNQVSSFKLKLGYWYVTHKLQLKKMLTIFLIVLSVVLYGYSIYRVSMILLVEDKDFRQTLVYLTSDLIDYEYFHQANKPQDIQILAFDSADGRESRYDFIANIYNPNPQWVATEVLFQLILGNEVIAEKTSFVYPLETKYVAIFGQEISGGKPLLKIAKVDWRRYRRFAEFAEPRLRFTTSDIEFKSARDSGIVGELPVSTLNFKITNNSAYSYWQTGVYMVLLSLQRAVAANYIYLDQFLSGETRDIEMKWYESLSSVSKVEILPEVDILSADSFMPVK